MDTYIIMQDIDGIYYDITIPLMLKDAKSTIEQYREANSDIKFAFRKS